MKQFLFLELLKWYIIKFANTNTTAHGQKMMNTQIQLDIEEVRKFVGDFNKLFKDLEEWTNNAVQIETWKDHFF